MTNLELLRHLGEEKHFVVDSNEWSRRDFVKSRINAPELDKLARAGEEYLPGFSDLQVDGYHWFYQGNPMVKDDDEVTPTGQTHRRILNVMEGTEELKTLRVMTQRNKTNSLVAVQRINDVVENLPEEVQDLAGEQGDISDELEEKEEELESLRDLWETLDEQEENDDNESDDGEGSDEGEENDGSDDGEEGDEEGDSEGDGEGDTGDDDHTGPEGTPGGEGVSDGDTDDGDADSGDGPVGDADDGDESDSGADGTEGGTATDGSGGQPSGSQDGEGSGSDTDGDSDGEGSDSGNETESSGSSDVGRDGDFRPSGEDGQVTKEEIEARGEKLAEEVEELKNKLEDKTQELNEAFDQNLDDIRSDAREAMEGARGDLDELHEMASAYSCGSGGPNETSLAPDEMMKIAELMKDDEELRWIAEQAGRIDRIIKRTKQDKLKSAGGEIVDTEYSGDISRLTSSELSKLAHPVLKQDVFQRVADHKALSWVKEQMEDAGKGPIICCVDNSGSMKSGGYSFHSVDGHYRTDQYGYEQYVSGHHRYRPNDSGKWTPIIWAKAVALALYRECAARNQPFFYIHFSSSDGIKVRKFEAKPGEELEFMKFSQTFLDGGTDYELALTECLAAFEEDGMEKADVVFISDGEYPTDDIAAMTEAYKQKLEELGGKTLGVLITTNPERYGDRPFGEFANGAWALDIKEAKEDGSDVSILSEMFSDYLM